MSALVIPGTTRCRYARRRRTSASGGITSSSTPALVGSGSGMMWKVYAAKDEAHNGAAALKAFIERDR